MGYDDRELRHDRLDKKRCRQHKSDEATDRRGECRQRSADKRRFLSCGFRHLCAPNRSRRAYSNARTIVRSQAPEGGSMEAGLTIGRLAESAQVNVETVRYYQRRGLMREPARPMGGVRRYSDDDVRRIRFINRAQQLGFTLEEITKLLQLEDG